MRDDARLYRFLPDDFKDIAAVWDGEHPSTKRRCPAIRFSTSG